MKEIKFRGKRIDNGEWAYGAYFCLHHNDERQHIHHFIIPDNTQIPKEKPIGEIQVEVDPATVGQYTEYLKDVNKKCFCEGDIVCMADYPRQIPYLYEVILADDGFMLCSLKTYEDGKYARRISQFTENLIIIGNRWDNPDLMKQASC